MIAAPSAATWTGSRLTGANRTDRLVQSDGLVIVDGVVVDGGCVVGGSVVVGGGGGGGGAVVVVVRGGAVVVVRIVVGEVASVVGAAVVAVLVVLALVEVGIVLVDDDVLDDDVGDERSICSPSTSAVVTGTSELAGAPSSAVSSFPATTAPARSTRAHNHPPRDSQSRTAPARA